ncbi:MAG: SRPBCC family protein [Burkholderiales bacterium]|nr:SRPBCC family protein [Burkholderiales bacterium]
MASLRKDLLLAASADAVWSALRDFGVVHLRLAPGFVTATTMAGDAVRVVTFFNGTSARETLVSCDDASRRLVYAIIGGRAEHYSASAQVFDDADAGRCRFVWIVDVLPDAIAPYIDEMMTRGAAVMKEALEATSA